MFFHHFLVSHGAITPVWIFLTTFWGGYFSAGKASQAPFAMEASGSLVKTKQRLECWWGLHLYPRLFFFALLHPRNLQEGPSVVEAFSSSLDECSANPAVAKASELQVSVFMQLSFCHLFSLTWVSLVVSTKRLFFFFDLAQMVTVSHALCREIETGI